MSKIPLTLNAEHKTGQASPRSAEATPLSGYMAVGFGLLGIFGPAILFTPLALLFSLVALLKGQGSWGFVGLLLTMGGILGSPILMGLIGAGALYAVVDWQEILKPLYDSLRGGVDI